jgi:acetyl esterase
MLSSLAGCIVVNVEYRMAPEHKFPAMMNDSYDSVRWVLANRSLVGGTSKSKVGVAGDSAGGQNAASVSHNVPGLDFQILIYPWLNIGGDTSNLPSHQQLKDGPLSMEGLVQWIMTLLVEKKEDLIDPRLCLFRNEKYDNLPPTLFIVAEYDPLRDESYEYSKRLTAAGVDSEVFLSKGAVHGYFTAPGAFAELCSQSYAKAVEFINKIRKQ